MDETSIEQAREAKTHAQQLQKCPRRFWSMNAGKTAVKNEVE